MFKRAELGDYRLLVGSGIGSPLFVLPDATGLKSTPLQVESNSRIPRPLDNLTASGFFDSKQGQSARNKVKGIITGDGCSGGGEG
ncbi:hypothetical protein ES708_13196 [subsurface metagenome]